MINYRILSIDRECVSPGAAGARTCRSLGHHLLHLQILTLLVLLKLADFEAQSSLLQNRLHPQFQIPNAYPVNTHIWLNYSMYFVAVIAYAQLGYSISDSHYFLTSTIFLVRILSIRLTRKYDINESKCNILFNTSTRIITLNYTIVEPPIVSICRYLWGS